MGQELGNTHLGEFPHLCGLLCGYYLLVVLPWKPILCWLTLALVLMFLMAHAMFEAKIFYLFLVVQTYAPFEGSEPVCKVVPVNGYSAPILLYKCSGCLRYTGVFLKTAPPAIKQQNIVINKASISTFQDEMYKIPGVCRNDLLLKLQYTYRPLQVFFFFKSLTQKRFLLS